MSGPLQVSFKDVPKKKLNHSEKSIEIMTGVYGSSKLAMPGMKRTITAQAKRTCLTLWKVMDSYKDGKIQFDEWAFVLKKLQNEKNNGNPVFSESDSKFLFTFLDKTGNGEVTKTEFEGLFNDVCAKNENMNDHITLLQLGLRDATDQQTKMGGIDFKIHQELNDVDAKVTRILANMETAKIYYTSLVENCANPPPKGEAVNKKAQPYRTFYDGYRVFESPCHTYKGRVLQYHGTVQMAGEGLKNKYNQVLERLDASERVVHEVNVLLQNFIESGVIINELKERDAKCCKVFGMLCC